MTLTPFTSTVTRTTFRPFPRPRSGSCGNGVSAWLSRRGRWKWRTWKWRTIEMSRHESDGHGNDGHEVDGREIDGHENAGHVSGVWIGLHGIDFDLAVLPSNRLLCRFQECSRSRSKLKTIRLYSDDHCVFHRCQVRGKTQAEYVYISE